MELLKETWWMESPIDFEHKQYVLFGYLQKVDLSFSNKVLSPYLLHTERLVSEMQEAWKKIEEAEMRLTKRHIILLNGGMGFKIEAPKIEELETIREILQFSVPLLSQRVELGRILHKRNKGLLF